MYYESLLYSEVTQEEICIMKVHRKKYVLWGRSLKADFDDLKTYIIIFR